MSINKQEIIGKFVEREVYSNVNLMVEYILNKSYEDHDAPFTHEDIENYYLPKCGECGDFNSITELESEDGEVIYECSSCNERFEEEPDTEPQEIYEWWIVSDWLASELEQKGEPIIEHENLWGRTTTGQAILLDGVINSICEELGLFKE